MKDYDSLTHRMPRSAREAFGQDMYPDPVPDIKAMLMLAGCGVLVVLLVVLYFFL